MKSVVQDRVLSHAFKIDFSNTIIFYNYRAK